MHNSPKKGTQMNHNSYILSNYSGMSEEMIFEYSSKSI